MDKNMEVVQLTEWHYRETLTRCKYSFCQEYNIPSHVHEMVLFMCSRGVIDDNAMLYITETVHTQDRLLQLFAKINDAKHKSIKEAFEDLLHYLSEENQRSDIAKTLTDTLTDVSKLQPQKEEELYDRVKRIEANFMYISPFEVMQSLKLIITDYSAWLKSARRSIQAEDDDSPPPIPMKCEDEPEEPGEPEPALYECTVDCATGDTPKLSPLMHAAVTDDYDKLVELLETSADSDVLNEINGEGDSLLIVACKKSSVPFVRRLVSNDLVDVNSGDSNGTTPFMHSVMRGDVDVIDALLGCPRVMVNMPDRNGLTFIWFIFGKDLIKQLVSKVRVANDRRDLTRLMENVGGTMKELQMNHEVWNKITDVVNVLLLSNRIDSVAVLKSMLLIGDASIVDLVLQSTNLEVTRENSLEIILLTISSNNSDVIKLVAQSTKIPFWSVDNASALTILKHAHAHAMPNVYDIILSLTRSSYLDKTMRLTITLLAMDSLDPFFMCRILEGYDISNLGMITSKGNTIFMELCRYGSYRLLAELLKHKKIDLRYKNKKKQNALMKSFKNQSNDVPLLLYAYHTASKVKPRLNVNRSDTNGVSYLMLACAYNNSAMVDNLLDSPNINVDAFDKSKSTALMLACDRGNAIVVAQLLEHGASVNVQDRLGMTPLHDAARGGHASVVLQLLSRHANVNAKNMLDMTPLHDACRCGYDSIVSQLLVYGADVSIQNIYSMTPLHEACSNGHASIVSQLVLHGAHVNLQDGRGMTALHEACGNGDVSIVSLLLGKGGGVNVRDNMEMTLLHEASRYGHIAIVSLLDGIDVHATNLLGMTALHEACSNGHTAVITHLLERGAHVNVKDKRGMTPLHEACLNGHLDAVEQLISSGADIKLEDTWGMTPLHMACCTGNINIVRNLITRGAITNAVNVHGISPIVLASAEGHASIVSKLLQNGADLYVNPNTKFQGYCKCWYNIDIDIENMANDPISRLVANARGNYGIVKFLTEFITENSSPRRAVTLPFKTKSPWATNSV